MPNLLTDYDVLGFDADHCVVKYNTTPLVEMLVESELDELIEMGYPKAIKNFFFQESPLEMCVNGAIYDIDNGLVVKLVEGQEVARAMRGWRNLSQKEIKEIYGNPPILKSYVWPNTSNLSGKRGSYWVCITFFDTPKVALVLSAIEMMDQGLLKGKTYFDVAEDIRTIIYNNYIHFSEKEVKKIGSYGRFFPTIVENPAKYIQFQPSLRKSIQKLKDNGKRLFLATNSHTEYSNLIMTATLGDDWKDFFDIVCCYCRKPLFFWDIKTDPFFELDQSKANQKGKAIVDQSELKQGTTYTQGNSRILTEYFKRVLQKEDIRVAFFGDQYISDVYSSSLNENWDAFAVVEEMNHYDDRYCEGVSPLLMKYEQYWGESYFIEKSLDGKRIKKNYFISQVEDCARYMLPLMKNINLMMGDSDI
ncbi:UNKNOWN [Stylonychia lemnae]|uniref:Uncharacterized protein n=1 Tax=Stylonychia lemnae TaxID=5949 RepID=A0A078BA83_STYLE|nr:UNKNOWN [Stylonychia lemnae]|eukprot:CDW90182.1 UNKNOWN [Stylonychia lemnae]